MLALVVATGFALAHWVSIATESRKGILITKPMVMLPLIGWLMLETWQKGFEGSGTFAILLPFLLALLFSLAGDVFLLWSERFFLPGLISFMLAHICYIIGFRPLIPPAGGFLTAGSLFFVLVLVGSCLYKIIARSLRLRGRVRMLVPLAAYSAVLSLMLFTAGTRFLQPEWELRAALLAAVGAVLFYMSDIMNAWVRFVQPISHHQLKIMITYHIAQLSLTASIMLHTGGS